MKDFFDNISKKREAHFSKLDQEEFVPKIRNHLVQLFRKAHVKEPGLTGMICGNGGAVATGTCFVYCGSVESGKISAQHWDSQSNLELKEPDIRAFLDAVNQYGSSIFSGLPYIDEITLDDLKTTRSKKSKVFLSGHPK